MSYPKHSALFRDSLGGITIRHFPRADDASQAAQERELPAAHEVEQVAGTRRKATLRSPEFARALGVSTRTVRRAFLDGDLPGAVEHGERHLVVPAYLLRIAQAYGLRGLRRLAKAGRI